MVIRCPACQGEVLLAEQEADIRKKLTCPHCLIDLEVTWLYPLTLDTLEADIHPASMPIDQVGI